MRRASAAAILAIVAATAAPLAAQRARPWGSPEVLPDFKIRASWAFDEPRVEAKRTLNIVSATLSSVPKQAQVEAIGKGRRWGIVDAYGTCIVSKGGHLQACRWRDFFPASADAHRFVARLVASLRVTNRAADPYGTGKVYVRLRWEDDGEVVGTPPDCGPIFCGVTGLHPAPTRLPAPPGE